MLLFSLTNDLPLLFSFLLGVGAGLAVFALIYLVLALSTMRKKSYVVKTKVKDVSDQEVYDLIKQTQELFKDKDLKGNSSSISYCKDLCSDLVLNIAKKFFPESKHPIYEISIDEVLMLAVYVSERLDQVLDHKALRIFRKFKISTIVGMTEMKEKFEANAVVKATRKYKVMEALSAAKKVLNIVNPVYWAKKFFMNTAINVVVNKLCVVIIGIVGEETYKIYSKSVFDKDVTIDSGIDELVLDLEQEIENGQEENKDEDNVIDVTPVENEKKPETKKKGFLGLFRKKEE